MFSPAMKSTSLYKLATTASIDLQERMFKYFNNQMDVDTKNAEDDEERKEKLVAAISRPVAYKCFLQSFAPSVLIHLAHHGKTVNEVVKAALHKMRDINPAEEWKMIFLTLKQVLYSE